MLERQIYLFDTSSTKLDDSEAILSDKKETHREGKLICRLCKQVITFESERMEVHGKHHHDMTNPAGYQFHIGCFAIAPGCAEIGQPVSKDTWFPGSEWQISLCSSCGEHLGWKFSGVNDFYGLVLARLEKETPGE